MTRFEASVMDLPGVSSVHHTHCWSIDGQTHVLTMHVVMRAAASRREQLAVKDAVRRMVGSGEFAHLTIDVELEGEECASSRHAVAPEPGAPS